MIEPPIRMDHHGVFHTGADAHFVAEPQRRTYRHAASQIAFRALTSGKLAARLLHVLRVLPADGSAMGEHHVMGSWLIADPAGNITAHRGQYVGPGGPWDLADAIISGSRHAVQAPTLNGYYRDRPDAYRELVAGYEASVQCLLARHMEALGAGHPYAGMQTHADPCFLALLRAAIGDRGTQLVFHDWLAERGFPHVDELRSKRWNRGEWTENQLLDLLSKPFTTTRRSFSGRTV